jgi:hypothetical protein
MEKFKRNNIKINRNLNAILDISQGGIQRHCQVCLKEIFCKTRNKLISQEENEKRKREIRDNARQKENNRKIKEYFTYVLQQHVRVIIKNSL